MECMYLKVNYRLYLNWKVTQQGTYITTRDAFLKVLASHKDINEQIQGLTCESHNHFMLDGSVKINMHFKSGFKRKIWIAGSATPHTSELSPEFEEIACGGCELPATHAAIKPTINGYQPQELIGKHCPACAKLGRKEATLIYELND